MTRYIDKSSGCELISGIHDLSNAIELNDDHPVFKPLPEGHKIAWVDGLPVLQQIEQSYAAVEINLRIEREHRLSSAYGPAIQQLTRWIDSAEDTPEALADYKAQHSNWHAWADALCDLPDNPGWPWPDGEVPWPEQPSKPTRYNAP